MQTHTKKWIQLLSALLVCAALLMSPPALAATGSWLALKNPAPVAGAPMLLTDGSVMVQQNNGAAWYRLTPDSSGSYANGTWTQLASMHYTRLYFFSVLLKDGRVMVGGGEYGTGGATVEIYDPIQNTWTVVNSWPAGNPGSKIADSTAKVLPDGRVVLLPWYGGYWFYNAATDGWTVGSASKAVNDEQSVALLPDGSLFVPWDGASTRYVPALNQWLATSSPVNPLIDSTSEIGPAALLYDGRVFCLGATGNTGFYTPPGTVQGAGSWTAGPMIPNNLKSDDAPAAVMPNGNVLLAVDIGGQAGPTSVFEYDTVLNTYTNVGGGASWAANQFRMLLLPSGEVLVCNGASISIYKPNGAPKAAWQPVISQITTHADGTYTVSGTQLNGLTEGGYYGDDAQTSTNYPIVKLVSGSSVYYARSYNFSSMGVATGNASVSADFMISGIPNGAYSLSVVANGIASNPVPFTYTGTAIPIVKSSTTAAATKNAAFSYAIVATNSPASYAAAGLPAGLSINSATGAISGTPTVNGTFNIAMSASNAAGTGSATLVLSINAAPLITVAAKATPSTAEVGQSIALSVGASDPDGDPLLYSWANGTGGKTLYGFSSATQVLTYNSVGTYTAVVTVVDGHGHSATSSVSVTIKAGPSITTTSPLAAGEVSAPYSQTFAGSGGTPPYAWSAPFSAPPSGLALNASGVLSGTPTAAGTFSFTVRLTDAAGAVVNKSLTITINAAPAITTTSLPNGTVGAAYSQVLSGSGGTLPYAWSNTTALPPGLALSSSGQISGTPTTGGSFNFTVKLVDAVGGAATSALSLTIGVPAQPPAITSAATASGSVASPFSYTIVATNTPASFNATGLPAGLSVNTSTGVISGMPTTVGTSSVTISAANAAGAGSATLTLTVNDVKPEPISQKLSLLQNTSLGITLKAIAPSKNALTYRIVTPPAHGKLSGIPPSVTYTPVLGFVGADSFTFVANDGILDSNLGTISLTVNAAPPALNSAASAVPNPARVSEAVIFSVAANQVDGGPLSYAWDFGDGTSSSEPSPQHAYAGAGIFGVTVTISNSYGLNISSVVAVTVTSDSNGSGTEVSGTNGVPGDNGGDGSGGSAPAVLSIGKLQGSVNFKTPGHDALAFTGVLPGVSTPFVPAGKLLTLNISRAVLTYTLDRTGKAHTGNGSVAFKLKALKGKRGSYNGGDLIFTARLQRGSWAGLWSMSAGMSTATVPMTAVVVLDGTTYAANVNVNYAGKVSAARFSLKTK